MAKKEDRKRISLIGGPYDGETLVDVFLNVLDRRSSPGQPTVRYYRDPTVHDCFLVDDPNDSRLLIYKVQELARKLTGIETRQDIQDMRLSNLNARLNQRCKSWWERLSDRWDLLA